MYGVHPRLTVLDRNGDAYGLLFLNSAAQVNSETGSGKNSFVKLEGGWVDREREMGGKEREMGGQEGRWVTKNG